MNDVNLTVFFDYTCPWVRQAGIWLRRVQDEMGSALNISWRCFLLEQVNSPDSDWKAWEQDETYQSRGIWPHRGGLAARLQGVDAHWRYAAALFEAKHTDRKDVRSFDAIKEVAAEADLDLPRFASDAAKDERLTEIVADHTAAEKLEIFGTPTLIFEDAMPMFLKTFTPPSKQTMPFFDSVISVARQDWCGELKRPQPPWPRGVENV